MTVDETTSDLLVKVLLAACAAIAGGLVKTLMDSYRLRALMPVVLEQMRQCAEASSAAYSVSEAQRLIGACDAAFKVLSELVGLGMRPRAHWLAGAKLLLDMSAAVHGLPNLRADAAIVALERLRVRGDALGQWLALPRNRSADRRG
jgi:hypothetical protein